MTDQLDRLKLALADRYAIERELGSGGMATVYLAHDLRHERQVAIKVLRPDLAATLGPERFHREIKIAAQLQHPHILPLLDSGSVGESGRAAEGRGGSTFLYYVMPYVEGQSLREKLAKEGELPIGDAVRIMRDVVDALTEAHAHGVVHRDIKPENILLRGRHALVTDFGVAKAVSEATGREKLTTAGVALGTPAYMAPEQASADPHLDFRVDIYAVGAVAYELLTGRPVFMGTTPQMILSAHVTQAPDPVTKHRDTVPPALEAVVMQCLEKKPADRWQSAEELLPQLEALATPSGGMTPTQTAPVSAVSHRGRGRAVRIAAAVVVAAVAALLGWSALRPGPPEISLLRPRPVTRAPDLELYPAISPDGGEIVYAAGTGQVLHLYVRDVAGGRALPLTADRPGLQLFPQWTADGRSIVFVDASPMGILSLQQIPHLGGSVQPLAQNPAASGVIPQWRAYRVGQLLYAQGDSLFLRDLTGGEPRFVAQEDAGAHSFAWSPDGRLLAYVEGNRNWVRPGRLGNVAPSRILTVPVAGGEPVPVTQDTSLNVSPVWTPDGEFLLFISNRDGPRGLYAVRLDDAGHTRSEPTRVEGGIEAHSLSLSADGGTLAYSKFTFRRNIVRVVVPATGSASLSEAEPVTVGNQIVENHDVSRDGQWLAYDANLEYNQDLYLVPLDGGEPRRLTTSPADDYAPAFSPDGREIVFYSNRHGTRDIFLVSVDGGTETRLTDDPGEEQWPRFSPDGLHLVYDLRVEPTNGVYIKSRDSVGGAWSAPRLLAEGASFADWHPDGQRILVGAGTWISLISTDGQEQTRVDLGASPMLVVWSRWSPDGSFIWFGAYGVDMPPGVYEIAPAGGPLRLLVRLDAGVLAWPASTGPGNVLYMSVPEYESDIWVADLEMK